MAGQTVLAEQVEQAAVEPSNAFHFEGDTHYYEQGSAHWDEPEYVQRRSALRRSLKLQVEVLKFWELLGVRTEEVATKASYAAVHAKIAAVLAPDLTKAEAEAALQEDWAQDAGPGALNISLAQYRDGIFSIADLWTDSVEESDYLGFLRKLYRRISVRVQGKARLALSTKSFDDRDRTDVASLTWALLGLGRVGAEVGAEAPVGAEPPGMAVVEPDAAARATPVGMMRDKSSRRTPKAGTRRGLSAGKARGAGSPGAPAAHRKAPVRGSSLADSPLSATRQDRHTRMARDGSEGHWLAQRGAMARGAIASAATTVGSTSDHKGAATSATSRAAISTTPANDRQRPVSAGQTYGQSPLEALLTKQSVQSASRAGNGIGDGVRRARAAADHADDTTDNAWSGTRGLLSGVAASSQGLAQRMVWRDAPLVGQVLRPTAHAHAHAPLVGQVFQPSSYLQSLMQSPACTPVCHL